ncbi:MAG: DNA-3-methyladenine glycosylase 2 family protein [Clostridia bacterium]|nr:DNA-3-methyladenine glycosylase 2 family protein [Clostridia bacterium]
MDYRIEGNKIIFNKTEDFDAQSILECGQMFRFFKTSSGYKVITGKHIADIVEKDGEVVITTNSPSVFVDFFDLDTDYAKIKQELEKYPILKKAISFGKGIRIAKGETEEIIFQFIISQNNNIKRIQKIVEKLSEIGEKIDDNYNAFPSAKVLSTMPIEYFQGLGAGYRDKYLYETAKVLANINLEEIKKLDDEQLYKWLLSLKGVGPKVASCIMLFGFGRKSSFPVDTWIEKVYKKYFYNGEMTRPQISAFLQGKFGVMSGIVQQYLFYYFRSSGEIID